MSVDLKWQDFWKICIFLDSSHSSVVRFVAQRGVSLVLPFDVEVESRIVEAFNKCEKVCKFVLKTARDFRCDVMHSHCIFAARLLRAWNHHRCECTLGYFNNEYYVDRRERCLTNLFNAEFPFPDVYCTSKSSAMIAPFLKNVVATGFCKSLTLVCNRDDFIYAHQQSFLNAFVSPACQLDSIHVEYDSRLVPQSTLCFVASCKTLKSFTLVSHLFSIDLSCETIIEAFVNGKHRLELLDISAPDIDQLSIDASVSLLQSDFCALQQLRLINSAHDAPMLDLSQLFGVVANDTRLKILLLSGISFHESLWSAFCNMLLNNSTLVGVQFYMNQIEWDAAPREGEMFAKEYHALVQPLCHVLRHNRTLRSLNVAQTVHNVHFPELTAELDRYNFFISQFGYWHGIAENDTKYLRRILERNASIVWQKAWHDRIVAFCVSLAPIHLPAYVLLDIFDWLPLAALVNHRRKIDLIERVQRTITRHADEKTISAAETKKINKKCRCRSI